MSVAIRLAPEVAAVERVLAQALASGDESAIASALADRLAARQALIAQAVRPSPSTLARVAAMMAPLLDPEGEHLVMFDNRGRALAHVFGRGDEVAVPTTVLPTDAKAKDEWGGALMAHTHRSGSGTGGFSPDDMLTSASYLLSASVVMYRWRDELRCQTVMPKRAWPSPRLAQARLVRGFNEARAAGDDDRWHLALSAVADGLGLDYTMDVVREP